MMTRGIILEIKKNNFEQPAVKITFHFITLLILTVPFWVFNMDIHIQHFFYNESQGWLYDNNPAVLILYNYGVLPALICGAIASVVFGLGFAYSNLVKFRKQALLIMLVLLLAPGFIINVALKNYSGRPRPREITEFGGPWKFKYPLEFGVPGKGYSFPCGHCSMGFLFYAFYLMYKGRDRFKSNAALGASLLYGAAMGAGRMMQGAHFASDVLWAGGITIITAEIVYYGILKMNKQYAQAVPQAAAKRKYALSYGIAAILLAAIVGLSLLSTPFYEEKKYELGDLKKDISLKLNMEQGDANLSSGQGQSIILKTKVRGFGMPGIKYKADIKTFKSETESQVYANLLKNGIFSELNASLEMELAQEKNYQIIVNNRQGDLSYSGSVDVEKMVLYTGGGDINFKPQGNSKIRELYLKTKAGDITINLSKDTEILSGADFNVRAENGIVYIINKSKYLPELNEGKQRFNGSKEIIYKSRSAYIDINAKKIIIY